MATDVWQLVNANPGPERRSRRRALAVGSARVHDEVAGVDARLLDLSIYGCRLKAEGWQDEGDRLWLRFDGGWPISATVVWCDGERVGCRFDEPISQSLMRELTRALT